MRDLRQGHGAGLHKRYDQLRADRFSARFPSLDTGRPVFISRQPKKRRRSRIQLFCDAKMRYPDRAGRHTALFLNNKPYFQAGVLDQGYWPESLYTAPTDEALTADISRMKKLGFNMLRKHAKSSPSVFTTTATNWACSSGRTW